MSTHAKFSPSASSIWLRCGLYIRMVSLFPRTSNAAADEGTRQHEVGSQCLLDGTEPEEEGVKEYVSTIRTALDRAGSSAKLYVEEKVHIFEDCNGTADAAIVSEESLEVFDYKSGKAPVRAEGNSQLILYALGFLQRHEELSDDANVKLVIVQPNKSSGNSVDEWKTTAGRVREHKVQFLKAAERASRTPPPAMAGRHCWWCPAKLYCVEYKIMYGARKCDEE